jgi:hypothetical protein
MMKYHSLFVGIDKYASTLISDLTSSILMADSLCLGQEKHTMCELEVQIRNPG